MSVGRVFKGDMLTETQEKLLQKYADGECNALEKLMIQRLRKRPEALSYLSDLEAISPQIKSTMELHSQQAGSQSVDLWDRISVRLEQEDRAALFLGKRKPVVVERFSFFSKQAYVGAGALAAACLALLVVIPSSKSGSISNPAGTSTVANEQSGIPSINLASTNTNRLEPPRFLNSGEVPTSVEVDWMHSAGRVKMIQSPEGGSDIIWVRRPANANPIVRSRRPVVSPSFSYSQDLGSTQLFSK